MEKRLILAVALSTAVLIFWSSLFGPKHTPKKIAELPLKSQPTVLVAQHLENNIDNEPLVEYSQDVYNINFIEEEAAIKDVVFKQYQSYRYSLGHAFQILDSKKNLIFKKDKATTKEIVFVQTDQDKEIKKAFKISNTNYYIELEINVQNKTTNQLPVNNPLVLGLLDFKNTPEQGRYLSLVLASEEKTLYSNGRKNLILDRIKFVGLRDRYFCAIIEPLEKDYSVSINFLKESNLSEIVLLGKDVVLAPGEQLKRKFRIYLGPEDLSIIKPINFAWAEVVNYGFFDFISQILLFLLGFFYNLVHNWGMAIIVLSAAVYFILYPLTLKQMRSMKEMQALQPKIEELRKTYKDNPQKLHKETLELYRLHKVNPFGGCLPILLQMPIFFALYQALIRSVALKGAGFLWIKDLSEPDRIAIIPHALPIIGNEINLLPILMAITMFIQQKISTANTNSEYAEQQKIMTIIFPVLFGFIFYKMPSGLVLYWFVNSLFTVVYQIRISRAK